MNFPLESRILRQTLGLSGKVGIVELIENTLEISNLEGSMRWSMYGEECRLGWTRFML